MQAALNLCIRICGGEQAIMNYTHWLARVGCEAAASILGTEMMENKSETLSQCCFAMIRLPLHFRRACDTSTDATPTMRKVYEVDQAPGLLSDIKSRCLNEHNTWFPVKFYAGQIWVRLSAQIYLSVSDFEWAAQVLKTICDDLSKKHEDVISEV